MPATNTAETARLATISARDIIARATRACGPVWARLSPDGQMIECKAILCDDMLRNYARDTAQDWWLSVQRVIINASHPHPSPPHPTSNTMPTTPSFSPRAFNPGRIYLEAGALVTPRVRINDDTPGEPVDELRCRVSNHGPHHVDLEMCLNGSNKRAVLRMSIDDLVLLHRQAGAMIEWSRQHGAHPMPESSIAHRVGVTVESGDHLP